MTPRRLALLIALLCTAGAPAAAHEPGSGRLEPAGRGKLRYVHPALGIGVLLPRGFAVEAHEKHSADVELQGPGGCTLKLQRLLPETEASFTSWTEWAAGRSRRTPGASELRVGGRPALQWRGELLTTLVGVTDVAPGNPDSVRGHSRGHVLEILGWWEGARGAAACRRAYDEALRSLSFL